MIKRSILAIGIFLLILTVWGLLRQMQRAIAVSSRLDLAIEEHSNDLKENRELKQKLEWVKTEAFMEEVARNKLNLSKPGEIVLLSDKEAFNRRINEAVTRENLVVPSKWERWLKLIWG